MNQTVRPAWLSRNWKWFVPTLCFTGLLVLSGFIALVFYGVSSMMKSSDAYQLAILEAKSNPEVTTAIGEPINAGFFTTGSINSSGSSGSADMAIPISGPKGEGTIYLSATQSVGKWTFNDLIVEIKKTKDRVDLLQEKETLGQ